VISYDTVREVARLAGARHVLIGNYVKAGDTIRINVTLQEADSGRIVTAEHLESAGEANLFPMVDTLTRRLQTQLAATGTRAAPADLLQAPGSRARREMPASIATSRTSTSSVDAYALREASFLERGSPSGRAAPKATVIDPAFALARSDDASRTICGASTNGTRQQAPTMSTGSPSAIGHPGFYHQSSEDHGDRPIAAYEKLLALYPMTMPASTTSPILPGHRAIRPIDQARRSFAEPGAVDQPGTFPTAMRRSTARQVSGRPRR
jgi:hypothetical protein